MKDNIHPELFPTCFVDIPTGKRFFTMSTMKSKQKETIDGTEYFIVLCDTSSASHPAYSGNLSNTVVDTAGRIKKFNQRFELRADLRNQSTQTTPQSNSKTNTNNNKKTKK